MKTDTTRFGTIDIPEDKIIDFPEGIIGFSQIRKFVIIRHRNSEFLYWLQSVEKPEVAFLMMFPFSMMPDYSPKPLPADLEKLGLSESTLSKAEFYNITIVPKDPKDMTVNLLSPIVVNPAVKKGRQVVLEDSRYTIDFKIVREINRKLEQQDAKDRGMDADTQTKKE